jgi:hypothetical protein
MDINISTKVLEFPHVVQHSIVDGQFVSCHLYIFLVVNFTTKYYPQMQS